MKRYLFTVLLTLVALIGQAEVKLPKIFADHMVLQRGQEIPVWGTADPRERIEVTFKDQTYTTRADKAGQWKLKMASAEAGGPFVLTVKGKNTITIQEDRKSTRLNSSHVKNSYAVFCLKKKRERAHR